MTPDTSESAEPVSEGTRLPPVCLVLLGASNLSRGCFALVRNLEAGLHPRRVEAAIASGPGRAYCVPGGLLNVAYPPIQSCGVLEAAKKKYDEGFRVLALVTDIGNDIMYGVSADDLIATLEQMFGQLAAMEARVCFTTLPIRIERGIHPAWYYTLRTLLLPSSRVSYEEARSAIRRVNQYLNDTASRKAERVPDMDRYLGYDEIHYKWLQGHRAWSHMARSLLGELGVSPGRAISFREMIRSYGEELRKVVGVDMAGIRAMPPGHF